MTLLRLDPPTTRISRPAKRRLRRRAPVVIAALVFAVPLLVAAGSVAGRRYVPMGDEAAILWQSLQVGTLHTPLVGVYSSHGWSHPGPFLFYLLAIPLRLTGNNVAAPFVFVAVLNALSVVLSCALGWRRRGWTGLVLVGAGLALLVHGLGTDKLVRIWNPYVPLLLYFAFLLALWGVAERDRLMRPLSVALASAVVQLHVGYLPLVVVAAVSVGVHLRLAREPKTSGSAVASAGDLATLLVIALFWLAPLLDLAFGSRNLLRLLKYFGSSHTQVVGVASGLALINRHVGLTGSWASGREPARFRVGAAGIPWQVLVLTVLLIAVAILSRRGPRNGAALPLLAVGQLAAGSFAASKVEVPINSYLVVWMLPLAAFCWTALAVSIADLGWRLGARATLLTGALLTSGLVVGLGATVVDAGQAAATPMPQQSYAHPVLTVSAQLRRILDRRAAIRVEVLPGAGGRPGDGVVYALSQLDRRFYTTDGAAGQKWGLAHRWHGQRTAATLTVVATDSAVPDTMSRRCLADATQQRIAGWDSKSLMLAVFRGDGTCGAS